jgi:cholesterol transport system auxiliary component
MFRNTAAAAAESRRRAFQAACRLRGPSLRAPARGCLAALAALALSGCAALLPQTPSAIYDLSAPGEIVEPRGSMQILVPEPTAVRALDTDRIAARPTPAEYAYLPGAVWSDRLPKLLQARLVQTLQNSGRVRAAAVPGQGLLIDYQLVMDVRAFELTGEGAVVDLAVRLMDDRNGRVLRSRLFREVEPVASTRNPAVVHALDQAMDRAFIEIARWALR